MDKIQAKEREFQAKTRELQSKERELEEYKQRPDNPPSFTGLVGGGGGGGAAAKRRLNDEIGVSICRGPKGGGVIEAFYNFFY